MNRILLGSANPIVQLYVYPFTVPGLSRDPRTRACIEAHYEPFDRLREEGLGALIISGANVTNPTLDAEAFWHPLRQVMDWAIENVTSVMCSCLATHALVQHFHGVRRRRLMSKRWGVYPYRAVRPDHPLLRGTNTRFDVPHTRWNDITSTQLRQVGIDVLIKSTEGDFHLGVSADGFRVVYMQGHPEYDATSLLREFKREVSRYLAGELEAIPPYADNYLSSRAAASRTTTWRPRSPPVRQSDSRRPSPTRPSTNCSTTPGPTPARRSSTTGSAWCTGSLTARAECPSCPSRSCRSGTPGPSATISPASGRLPTWRTSSAGPRRAYQAAPTCHPAEGPSRYGLPWVGEAIPSVRA